jgi:hypothetical protein
MPEADISRKDLIRKFRALGYYGPLSGGRHRFMVRGEKKIIRCSKQRANAEKMLLIRSEPA